MPKLLPTLAAYSGQTYNSSANQTALIATFAAQQICQTSTQYCTGSNQQYDSYVSLYFACNRATYRNVSRRNDACMKYLTEVVPLGNPWEGGLDVSLVFPRGEV
jgi:hypothetical protein